MKSRKKLNIILSSILITVCWNSDVLATGAANASLMGSITHQSSITETISDNKVLIQTPTHSQSLTATGANNETLSKTTTPQISATETDAVDANLIGSVTDSSSTTETVTANASVTITPTASVSATGTGTHNEILSGTTTPQISATETEAVDYSLTGSVTDGSSTTETGTGNASVTITPTASVSATGTGSASKRKKMYQGHTAKMVKIHNKSLAKLYHAGRMQRTRSAQSRNLRKGYKSNDVRIVHQRRGWRKPLTTEVALRKRSNDIANKVYSKTGYIEFMGGISIPYGYLNRNKLPNKYKRAPLGAIALGLQLNKYFSTDLSVLYRGKYKWSHFEDDTVSQGITRNKIDNLSFLLNGRLTIDKNKFFKPYFLIGAGVAINKTNDIIGGEEKIHNNISYHERWFGKTIKSFTWHIGVGTFLEITQNIQLDLSYRFSNLGKYETSDTLTSGEESLHPLDDTGMRSYTAKKPIKGKQKTHDCLIGLLFKF